MASRVVLDISAGAVNGRQGVIRGRTGNGVIIEEGRLILDKHDVLLFGRDDDCHVQLPEDDMEISRHQFLLEVNPPETWIHDLGSLNGTYVRRAGESQWQEIGRRGRRETPTQGAKRQYQDTQLRHADQIKAGLTVITITVETVVSCCRCGKTIREFPKVGRLRSQEGQLCAACREHAEENRIVLLEPKKAVLAGGEAFVPEISGYEVDRAIGKGGFGAVYLAKRSEDGRQVALKVMLSRVAVQEKARNDFLREIEVTQSLSHPNIVTLLDHGSGGDGFYFVMEYYPNGSIADLMKRKGGALSVAEAAPLMLQSLTGLAWLHHRGVVHRDLKPDNIMLEERDGGLVARISDLGLAKNFERAGFSGNTVTGQYAGAYQFMPREQLTNFRYLRPASDLWSMGATFYNMLTGYYPHDFPKDRHPADVVLDDEVVPIARRNRSLPAKLARVMDRSVSREIKNRYRAVEEMISAVEKVLSDVS